MAKTIQIRNVPDDVHHTLRVRAAEADMSLSDYVLKELTRVARRPPIADLLLEADRRGGGADIQTIVSVIREARDRE